MINNNNYDDYMNYYLNNMNIYIYSIITYNNYNINRF